MDKKETKVPLEKSTRTENKDKNGNPVITYTGDEAAKLAKALFPDDPFFNPEKKNESDKKFNYVVGFIFTYFYPATPFLQLVDRIENKYIKKPSWIRHLGYTLSRLIVGVPFLLGGMLYLGNSLNEGWRVGTTSAFFGIILVLSYLITVLGAQLIQYVIWTALITVYVFGYFQLFIYGKQK